MSAVIVQTKVNTGKAYPADKFGQQGFACPYPHDISDIQNPSQAEAPYAAHLLGQVPADQLTWLNSQPVNSYYIRGDYGERRVLGEEIGLIGPHAGEPFIIAGHGSGVVFGDPDDAMRYKMTFG